MTRDEFQALYERGPDATFAVFQNLLQQLDTLTARVKELENRLGKDSHNSSKPPSSDGFKKKPKSLRAKSGNKPGAQPGHPGTTLYLLEEPDQLVLHSPARCWGCGTSLRETPACRFERRQVHDLPPLSLLVTEHRALSKVCPHCQLNNQAAFPEAVAQPVQYGQGIKALGVYLQQYQLLPFARTRELLGELLGTCVCEGTLANALCTCYERLAPVEAAIKEAITQAEVAHFDETGARPGYVSPTNCTGYTRRALPL